MPTLKAPAALPATNPATPPVIDPVAVNAVLISVRQAAQLLCDRWTLLILLAAHSGVTRFADFRERCGAANRLLSSRLLMLEEEEVMVRLAYMRRPLRHGYHLTHMGLALFDVFAAMLRWEQRWHGDGAGQGAGLSIEHLACGHTAVQPVVGCAACQQAVSPRETDLTISQKEMRQMPQKATAYRRSTITVAREDLPHTVPLPHSVDIFGDKWSIEVLMCAFLRVSTFGAIQAHTGISTGILTDRLARLTASGLLQQNTTAEGQRRGAYRLTEKGLDLFPVLVCIEAWADEWQRDRYRSPMHLTHHLCGQPLKLQLRCDRCAQPLQRGGCNLHGG